MSVLITGANRGIGARLADMYRADGADVIGTSRAADAEYRLDVTRPSDHIALAAQLGDRAIDLLVCNAGVYLDKGQVLSDGYPADMWAQTFAANVTGVFLTVQAFLPHLKRARQPKIAIISSQMASHTRAPGGSYIYRASKAAVLNVGRNLSTELKPENIAVGIYHPGWVQTDMGGPHALIDVQTSVSNMRRAIDGLTLAQNGGFFNYDGAPIPW